MRLHSFYQSRYCMLISYHRAYELHHWKCGFHYALFCWFQEMYKSDFWGRFPTCLQVTSLKPDDFTPKIISKTADYLYVEYESPTFGVSSSGWFESSQPGIQVFLQARLCVLHHSWSVCRLLPCLAYCPDPAGCDWTSTRPNNPPPPAPSLCTTTIMIVTCLKSSLHKLSCPLEIFLSCCPT